MFILALLEIKDFNLVFTNRVIFVKLMGKKLTFVNILPLESRPKCSFIHQDWKNQFFLPPRAKPKSFLSAAYVL